MHRKGDNTMNYASLKTYDTANGPGVRVSLFVSGCEHYCKDCFNSEAWDFNYGKEFTEDTLHQVIEAMTKSWIYGITILGGEPMNPKNVITVSEIIARIRCSFPNKTIWVYSGYTLEELLSRYQNMFIDSNMNRDVAFATGSILKNIDVLVDGRFVAELKDLKLRFRGSSNQRIINMKKYWETGEITEPELPA